MKRQPQLGRELKALRVKKNLHWKDIENQTGFKRQSISAIEEGRTSNPGFYTLIAVIIAYGQNPIRFLGMDKPERQQEALAARRDVGRRSYDVVWQGTFPAEVEIKCAQAAIAALRKVL
jgi:transcriptional regulator with XRE-family HTH domain